MLVTSFWNTYESTILTVLYKISLIILTRVIVIFFTDCILLYSLVSFIYLWYFSLFTFKS